MNKREKVFKKTNGRCIYCGSIISYDNFHIDHKNPKSNLKKDFDNIDNLFPSCCDCNLSKGNLSIENFLLILSIFIKDNSFISSINLNILVSIIFMVSFR